MFPLPYRIKLENLGKGWIGRPKGDPEISEGLERMVSCWEAEERNINGQLTPKAKFTLMLISF